MTLGFLAAALKSGEFRGPTLAQNGRTEEGECTQNCHERRRGLNSKLNDGKRPGERKTG